MKTFNFFNDIFLKDLNKYLILHFFNIIDSVFFFCEDFQSIFYFRFFLEKFFYFRFFFWKNFYKFYFLENFSISKEYSIINFLIKKIWINKIEIFDNIIFFFPKIL